MRIPLVVCAKNEEAALGACLDSLDAARVWAEARLELRFDLRVVLDGSEAVARARGVRVERSRGGKVEAQRRGADAGAPFVVFSDADIAVERDTLHALARLMLDDPTVAIAHPPKLPVAPSRRTPLAEAIHLYNRHRGFSAERTWFSGKLFAIRAWSMPARAEIAPRLAALEPFYRLDGLRVDDIYLSRATIAAHGVRAIRETAAGCVWFRAPETWRGMYRYYRRMRMELERLALLFPEQRALHQRWGVRRTDPRAVEKLSARERRLFALFRAAVGACRVAYVCERAYHRRLARAPRAEWQPIEETKQPIDAGFIRRG
jgi:glycosyltransferase involved in cell wall biosynthesis